MEYDKLTEPVIQAAIEVHKRLGPGLLEPTYVLRVKDEIKRFIL